MGGCMQKLIRRLFPPKPLDKAKLTLNEYQRRVWTTRRVADPAVFLYGLVTEVGDIHAVIKRRMRQSNVLPLEAQEIIEEIGDLLWYLAAVASNYDIELGDAACKNLSKVENLFGESEYHLYDETFPKAQQIPRHFEVAFEFLPGEIDKVKISMNGRQIGATVDDNAMKPDGYRIHDAFHIAFAACLGWSPVFRALIKHKRKESKLVDRTEDGARAAAVEEAVSAYVFEEWKHLGGFEDPKLIPFDVIKTCKRITQAFEVKDRNAQDWELAISTGCRVFNELKEMQGGIVAADLIARTVTVRKAA